MSCILAFFTRAQASGYTRTTLSDLGCFPGPHKQCIYKLSLGLDSQTILSFIQQIFIESLLCA